MFDSRVFLCVLSTAVFSSAALATPTEDNKRKSLFYIEEAEAFEKKQFFEEASASMAKAIKLDPKNWTLHARQCDFLFASQDDDKEALKAIDSAISLIKSPPPEYIAKKAIVLERLKRYPEALSCINKAIAARSTTVSSKSSLNDRRVLGYFYSQRASIRKSMNRLQDSENDLGLAIKLEPESGDLRIHRAHVSSELNNWPLVVTDASLAIKASHRGSPILRKREAYVLLGRAYAGLKNIDKATSTYLTALKECPDDRMVLNDAQKYFASIGDKKNAEAVQKRLNSLDQDFVPFK